jgi:5,10-methylene-tetrahydrofolate dehydrogenase/methenyl tetrahydrofolate cyclohydrolase
MTRVIDGKAIAADMNERTAKAAGMLRERGVLPREGMLTAPADVLVVAAGQPELVDAGHVAPGAVVIDVGLG